MKSKAPGLILTKSQAACLAALQHHKTSKTEIAIQAKLDLRKTAIALDKLEELGLARRGETNTWRTTRRGRICRFEIVSDRVRRNGAKPGPGARRLLELLDQPMRGSELAERLGVTTQRVHQLVVKLYAQGHVRLGDPERILQIVSRISDKTPLLSRDEQRVLSAIPDEYATNATKIRLAVLLPENRVLRILERLIANNFIEALDGLANDTVYRISAAGLRHPQRGRRARCAQAPRLPVESDRVRAVLSAVCDAGSLRIRELRDALQIPHDSIRALMQYLKRKALVQKTTQEQHAPYSLTDKGLGVLAEMSRRHAA